MKRLLYRNEQVTKDTMQALELARAGLQRVLDQWVKLDLGKLDDLMALVKNPEPLYAAALYADVEQPIVPGAKYQVAKDVYISTLSVPIPNELYIACRDARALAYNNDPSLWQVSDAKVELNQEGLDVLMRAFSLYVTTPKQEKLVKDLQAFCDLFNDLNSRLNHDLIDGRASAQFSHWCHTRFKLAGGIGMLMRGSHLELDFHAIEHWFETL